MQVYTAITTWTNHSLNFSSFVFTGDRESGRVSCSSFQQIPARCRLIHVSAVRTYYGKEGSLSPQAHGVLPRLSLPVTVRPRELASCKVHRQHLRKVVPVIFIQSHATPNRLTTASQLKEWFGSLIGTPPLPEGGSRPEKIPRVRSRLVCKAGE